MPIETKPLAIKIAVTIFFICAIAGWANSVSCEVCCKRGLLGAFIAYIVTTFALKIVNAILIQAIITKQIKKNSDTDR